MTQWVLLIHAASTWWMVGLIWFVQVVHYPLFRLAGDAGWPKYASAHRTRTTWVVMPPMLAEMATAALLAVRSVQGPSGVEPWLAWPGLACVAVLWASTFAVQVPLHARLSGKLCAKSASKLVATNWIRTTVWTLRGAIALLMMIEV